MLPVLCKLKRLIALEVRRQFVTLMIEYVVNGPRYLLLRPEISVAEKN
jgi:hypothetical protein